MGERTSTVASGTLLKTAEPVDVKGILASKSPLSAEDFALLRRSIATDQVASARSEMEALVRTSDQLQDQGQIVRAGVGAYLLAQLPIADKLLGQVQGNGLANYVHGLVLTSLERYVEAEQKFVAAAKSGFDGVECAFKQAAAIRLQGRLEDAEQTLMKVGAERARRADYSYQMGCILSDRGDTYGAVEYFERAVDMDPHHAQALFRLAGENALYGNDAEAVRYYEQALSKAPYYIGALMNLGLLYEDRGNYAAAAFCFRRVLAHDPTHARALMYMKDIEATQEMYYDDDQARNEARLQQLLNKPVTDFELSVRSRNCLASMDLHTLGDLTRVTEQDLLEGKNFGETSLVEIRELMSVHGLKVGQNLAAPKPRESGAAWPQPIGFLGRSDISPQEQALLGKPVTDLNLSVRARKCMARLNITTIGELVQRTADELLATKNFGVTSLNEIRQQLGEYNMKLRND